MTKKCIGLDIGRSHLRAVQMACTQDGLCVEKAFGVQTRRNTDSVPNILRALINEHGFDPRAEVVVSLPHHTVFFADIDVDAADLARLQGGATFMVEDSFPIAPGQAITQICSTRSKGHGRYSVLVAATSSTLLRDELSQLAEGKIQPAIVDSAITAARTVVATNHPESTRGLAVILSVDQSTLSLAVTRDGAIIMVRNIPMRLSSDCNLESLVRQIADVFKQEIEITWQKLFGADPDADVCVFLIVAPKPAAHLAAAIQAQIDCQIVVVDPYAKVQRTETVDADFPVCVAEGLALRLVAPDPAAHIDFLQGYRTRTRPPLHRRKELTVCVGLAAVIAIAWVIGLFLQLSRLDSSYAEVKGQIREVFRQTLPEEKNMVNPLAQLRQKIDAFRKDYNQFEAFNPGGPTPLEILRTLSVNIPTDGNLVLNDVLITAQSVRVMGTCDSFAVLSEWQRRLEQVPDFGVVDIANPTKDAKTGKVHFTISFASAQVEH